MTLLDWVMASPFAQVIMVLVALFLAIVIFALVVTGIEMLTGTSLGEWPGRISVFFRRVEK